VRATQDQGGKREWLVHPAKKAIQVRRDRLALKGFKAIVGRLALLVLRARFCLAKRRFVLSA
jgi:hypothetical protein